MRMKKISTLTELQNSKILLKKQCEDYELEFQNKINYVKNNAFLIIVESFISSFSKFKIDNLVEKLFGTHSSNNSKDEKSAEPNNSNIISIGLKGLELGLKIFKKLF
jgi:hypothetical protein